MTGISDTKEFESLEIKNIGIVELGSYVEHSSLGIGLVETISQQINSGDIKIIVKFDEYGAKIINPKHAHLTLGVKPDTDSFFKGLIKAVFSW